MSTKVMDVPGLFAPQREFIIHNASPDKIETGYDGETFTIPAVDSVIAPHPKYEDMFHSAVDADGKPIPGTLVIKDKIENRNANADLHGNNARGDRWDAAAAVRHCLGIDPNTKLASGKFWQRGISVLPPTASKDDIEAARKEGQLRWEAFQYNTDKELINSYRERAAKHRSLGLHPDAPPAEYYAAEARMQKKVVSLPEPEKKAPDKASLVDILSEDVEFMQMLKEKLAEKVEKPVKPPKK